MATTGNPDATDPDIEDPLAAPTRPLPLIKPTQALPLNEPTQLLVKKPKNPDENPKGTADTKFQKEYLASSPEAIREPAGQKAASQAGIERDGELKEMPGAILDIELRLSSHFKTDQYPKKAFAIVKSAIAHFQGALLHFIPTPKGYLRCQCIFPNRAQAHNAAVYIHQNTDNDPDHHAPIKKAKFGLAQDQSHLATCNGHLLVFGNAARMAMKLQHANPETAEVPVVATYEHSADTEKETILGNSLREEKIEEKKPLHSRETERSRNHAHEAVRLPNPDLPQVASRVEIRFPRNLAQNPAETLKIATGFIDAIAPHPMSKGSKYSPTHAILTGQILTIYLPEERAPGNLGERLESMEQEIRKNGLIIILSHSRYSAVALDEDNHTFQGALPPSATLGEDLDLDTEKGSAGIYLDDHFKEAASHERNASIAVFVTETKASLQVPKAVRLTATQRKKTGRDSELHHENLYKVQRIEIAKEAVVKGRFTVGREKEIADLNATLEAVRDGKTAKFTIINGEAGIGKTRHAVDAIRLAEEKGYCSVYYKTPENGKTSSLTGVRRMTKSLLAKLGGDAGETFRDLQFFSLGIVPPGEIDAYGKRVEALNQNQVLAAERLTALIVQCAQTRPLQLILDDLQWFDELSIAILTRVIQEIPQETPLHLALLGRSGEEPIPQDLTDAMSARAGHYHETSLRRIGNAAQIRAELLEEEPEMHDPQLQDRIDQKRFKLTKDYIYSNLPENCADAEIADGFVWKILEISEGLPIVISETVALLLEEGKIELRGSSISTPSNAELDTMKKDSTSETLSTIIQAKFDRLSEDEKTIIDYLVVLRETDLRLFAGLLKYLRLSEERIRQSLSALSQKGLIRTNPVGFTHDLIQKQRRDQLKDIGSLSRKAAACYLPLAANRSRFANLISPSQLFELLEIALENPEEHRIKVRTKLLEAQVPLGLEAADHSLQVQNQYRALQIVETLESQLTSEFAPYLYPPKSEEPDAEAKKTALALNLSEIHLRAAEAHIRLGHKTEPESALTKYARLSAKAPEAKVQEGERGFRYKVLRLKAAFAQRSREKLGEALTELEGAPELVALRTALKEATVVQDTGLQPHVMIAYGELIIAKLRLAGARQSQEAQEALDAVLPEAENIIAMLKTDTTSAEIKALRIDIERTIAINEAHIFRKQIRGNVEDALYMEEFTTEQQAKAAELEQTLIGILQTYLTDTQLVRDPQTLGFLYERIVEMQIIQDHRDEARKTTERGLRLSHNWGIPEAVSALNMLAGDEKTTQQIAKIDLTHMETIDSAKHFDEALLIEALENYTQGILAMERMGATNAVHIQTNVVNRTTCMALYAFSKLAKNPEFDTSKSNTAMIMRMPTIETVQEMEALKAQIRETWNVMIRVLLQLRDNYNPAKPANEPQNQAYLQELSGLGLLYKAARRIGISDIAIPDFIDTSEILSERQYLQQIDEKPQKPLSQADKKYLKLRKEGIVALIPGGEDTTISLADLDELL
ncbi:AAA family ATPase [Candidatus Peregrinibacteria bacterium]|nr:AAA family ATPase [Candidatus Peregrinibacteria bacterium]